MTPEERREALGGKVVYVGLVEAQQTEQQDAYPRCIPVPMAWI